MFEKEDFEIPLESKLRQRVIFDEIDHCTDIDQLKEQLKRVTGLFMQYQQLLNTVLAKQMEQKLSELLKTKVSENE